VTVYFGDNWGSPRLDGDAQHVDTPIGRPCLQCREPIEPGDQGFIQQIMRPDAAVTGPPVPTVMPSHTITEEAIHAECEALGIVGHQLGVCTCTGHDTTSRAAARKLWGRLTRIKRGA
jgi:hypothetical protein